MTWVLTYSIHSSIILLTILGISFVLDQRQLRLQNTLLKAALLTGFITATMQTAGDLAPIGGSFLFPQATEVSHAQPPQPSQQIETIQISGTSLNGSQFYFRNSNIRHTPQLEPAAAATFSWPLLFLAGWSFLAIVGLIRLFFSYWAVRRTPRTLVTDRSILGSVSAIKNNSGYRPDVILTSSEHITSPLAISHKEICLPKQVLDTMDTHQQRSVLAHEMAHLVRRDPLWFALIAVVEALFFFQPLNYLARLRMRATAEYLCDDWALQQTGRSLDLARCLSNVASWMQQRSTIPEYVAAMGSSGSLKKRVVRILDQNAERKDTFRYSAPVFALAMGVILLTTAPRFAIANAPALENDLSPSPTQHVLIQQRSRLIISQGSLQQRFLRESIVIIMPAQLEKPVIEKKPTAIIWH